MSASTHQKIMNDIAKYVNILPESMRYDSRQSFDAIYDKFLDAIEDLQRISKYANNPTKDASLAELEQALYDHEAPYYRFCASGAGSDPTRSDLWKFERNRLSALISIKNGEFARLQNSGWSQKSNMVQKIISKISWFK